MIKLESTEGIVSVTKMLERRLEHLVGLSRSPSLACAVRRMAVHPRYVAQIRACRLGFQQYGERYPQKVIFIAGLPKSGTTWLEGMIASYPGFHDVYLPEMASYELKTGGSHDYKLPPETFARFKDMLVVIKLHTPGLLHNVKALRTAGMKYVILYRDLRDVAVSYFFFVRQRPWHPEYPVYTKLSVHEGLATFAERTLLTFVDWIRSWHENRDPSMSLELQYEQMLSDPAAVMTRTADHLGLSSSPETIARIVEMNSFKKLSEGRRQGQENRASFFRKGVAGDWKNHYTPELRETYKELIGDFLIEFGYERDLLW